MSFIEQEMKIIHEEVNGKKVPFIRPEVVVTLKHKLTGKEYGSDAEAEADINDPNTETQSHHIQRSVKINVKLPPLGTSTNL